MWPIGVDVGETKYVLEWADKALFVNLDGLGERAVDVEYDKVQGEAA